MGLVYALITIGMTAYGQFIVKWRVSEAGAMPDSWSERGMYFLRLMTEPWILSMYVAVLVAGVCWMAALTKLELSYVYPFMSATFVVVLIGSHFLFSESMSVPKVVGVLLIVVGLAVSSQG